MKLPDNKNIKKNEKIDDFQFKKEYLSWKKCISCKSDNIKTLMIVHKKGMPHGIEYKAHQYTYRHIVVIACLDCDCGQIEIHDHDCWSMDEVWDLDEWYILDCENFNTLKSFVERCADPLSSLCSCKIHNHLNKIISKLPTNPWESYSDELKHIQKNPENHIHRITVQLNQDNIILSLDE
jgi:hypothetical protein